MPCICDFMSLSPRYDLFCMLTHTHTHTFLVNLHRAPAGDTEAAYKWSDDRDSRQACSPANSFVSLPHVNVRDTPGMFAFRSTSTPSVWLLFLRSHHFHSPITAGRQWRSSLMPFVILFNLLQPLFSVLMFELLDSLSRHLPFSLRTI